jgi:hypothetical protein
MTGKLARPLIYYIYRHFNNFLLFKYVIYNYKKNLYHII